jgi:NADPH-dependent ferric siderophore reductase
MLGPRDLVLSRATVEETRWITRRVKHIRLAGDDLVDIPWKPGQQLRVQVNPFLSLVSLRTALRDAVRTYSVWSCDPRRGVLDLGVLVHGSGPGSAWAERARIGDPVAFFGPTGSFVARPEAKRHFLFGDETAAFAFEAMVRSLPEPSSAWCCLEAPGPDDEVPPQGPGFAAVWVHRGAGATTPGSGLLDALRKLAPAAASGVAYVAGELSACRAIRDALVAECGFARRDVRVKPFWAPGRKGLD